MLVSPKEVQSYTRIAQIMAKNSGVSEDEAVEDFPVDMTYIPTIDKRVRLAIKADQLIKKHKKVLLPSSPPPNCSNSLSFWFIPTFSSRFSSLLYSFDKICNCRATRRTTG
jgi:hypothetical protein